MHRLLSLSIIAAISAAALVAPAAHATLVVNSYRFGLFQSAYVQEVLADSPYAYWRLSETAPSGSGALLDWTGNGRHIDAPASGFTWNQPGALSDNSGRATLGDGTAVVTAGSTVATAIMSSANWTVELWFFPRPSGGGTAAGTIFGAAADSTHRLAIQHFNNTIFTSSTVGGNKSDTTSSKVPNTWSHLVVTSAGDYYLNGVAQAGSSSATLNSTNQLAIGGLNNATGFFIGRIAEVAVYQSVLSSGRVAAHFAAGIAYTVPTGRTLYWDMESSNLNEFPPGTDNIAQFDGASLSSAQAYSGAQSLSVGGGTFRSATIDNPTSSHRWAPPTTGTIRCRFRYTGSITNPMLFQITGKDRTGVDDTNDAIRVTISSTGATVTYGYNGGGSNVVLTTTTTIAPDTWHYAELKWNTAATGGNPTMSLTINSTPNTTTTAIGAVLCDAFHHFLFGQDTGNNPTGMWIDDLEVFGSWQ